MFIQIDKYNHIRKSDIHRVVLNSDKNFLIKLKDGQVLEGTKGYYDQLIKTLTSPTRCSSK